MNLITRLLRDEAGADATEYALVAALTGLALIVGASALGSNINTVLNVLSNKINSNVPA